jgi:hypothetical protein
MHDKFSKDSKYVSALFLVDSDHRGYSDVVKKNVDKEFKDLELKNIIFKFAKQQRIVILSKNEKDFVENNKKSLLLQNCIYYLMENKSQDREKAVEVSKSMIYDSTDMQDYYEYLSLFKYSNSISKMNDWMKDSASKISTDDDYKNKCLK